MKAPKTLYTFNLSHLLIGLIGMILFFVSSVFYFRYEVKKARKLGKVYQKFFVLSEKQIRKDRKELGGINHPRELLKIPFADKASIVIDVKNVSIEGVIAPYNASIEKVNHDYFLIFRYDTLTYQDIPPFHTNLGVCYLDKEFHQKDEFQTLNTGSLFSEDPRFIQVGDKNYIVYNDKLKNSSSKVRTVHIAELDLDSFKVSNITNLDIQLNRTEKNWTPFVYNENNKPELFFEYFINPHKILKLPNPKNNELIHKNYVEGPDFLKLPWTKRWGEVRGGTPAKKIGNEYLGFFHSFFQDADGFCWYVMGAYTFESKPPFKITSISKYPILFEGIYDTLPVNSSDPSKRSIYPSGWVLSEKEGKEVIHVSCGENDSAIKIVTFDKQALLDSLEKIKR